MTIKATLWLVVITKALLWLDATAAGSLLDKTPLQGLNAAAPVLQQQQQQQQLQNKTSSLPCKVTPTQDIHNGSQDVKNGKGSISAAVSSSGVLTSKQTSPGKGQ